MSNAMTALKIEDTDMQVTLNVGGTIFHTTERTLQNRGFNNKLAKLKFIQPEPSFDTSCFGARSCFIDRDPTVFRYILNFLRDGRTIFPMDGLTAAQLYQEAKYYDLDDLVGLIAKSSMNVGGYCDLRADKTQ